MEPDAIPIARRFDMALCLEVAEHLHESSSEAFVSFLCRLSDVIVFSAAIPGQTGYKHCSEQYPDYWAALFAQNGYVYIDVLREPLWKNENVPWWYKQNMFFVVNKSHPLANELPPWNGNVYIHTGLMEMYVEKYRTRNADRLPPVFFGDPRLRARLRRRAQALLSRLLAFAPTTNRIENRNDG